MTLDTFDKNAIGASHFDIKGKMGELNKSFDSNAKNADGVFINKKYDVANTGMPAWLGTEAQALKNIKMDALVDNVKQMYEGKELSNGKISLGIKEISTWKGDSYSSIKSKAGYAAEVISTTKENIINEASGNGNKTYRADDRPDLFQRNDQYVDKIRVDSNGNIIERVQTKFVGKNGKECYQKLMDKDFDKYFEDGKVDKVEIPKDYYKDVKNEISKQRDSLEKQIDRVKQEGKTDVANEKQAALDRLNQRDKMIEQSNTTSTEAIQAVKHPKAYVAKQMAKRSAMDGVHQAEQAAIVTGAISTVDNVSKYMDGEISGEEAIENIAKDTGTAAVAGFGVGFVSSSASALMQSSSNELIKKVGEAGGGCAPAVVVSYGIEVHGVIEDYAEGTIDNQEFADGLARGAAKVAGGFVGSSVGSAAGPIGSYYGAQIGSEVGEISYEATKTVVKTGLELAKGETTMDGAVAETQESFENAAAQTVDIVNDYKDSAVELVNKTVNYAITTEAYATVVDKYGDSLDAGADELAKLEVKAKEYANKAIDIAGRFGQDAASDVRTAINSFNAKNALPFMV